MRRADNKGRVPEAMGTIRHTGAMRTAHRPMRTIRLHRAGDAFRRAAITAAIISRPPASAVTSQPLPFIGLLLPSLRL